MQKYHYSLIKDQKGSALIIALVVVTLLTVMSATFFEKLYRFAEASRGIENSNAAYYKALGAIEDGLFTGSVNKYTPWNVKNIDPPGNLAFTGRKLIVHTGGTSIPTPGRGNSPYNQDYNIIGLGEPIQLVIPNGVDWSSVYFEFRIPVIGGNTQTGIVGGASNNTGYILWTFASTGASLFASGETNIFQGNKINSSTPTDKRIDTYIGISNSGSGKSFLNFYTDDLGTGGANCAGFACTLKLSLIRPVITIDGRTLTFLEYRITGFSSAIPSQYMELMAEGYSYGFLRSRTIKFPQITTNTALDFAVLQ